MQYFAKRRELLLEILSPTELWLGRKLKYKEGLLEKVHVKLKVLSPPLPTYLLCRIQSLFSLKDIRSFKLCKPENCNCICCLNFSFTNFFINFSRWNQNHFYILCLV